jgi:hypothetical protein
MPRRLGFASLLVGVVALWSVQAQDEALPSNTKQVLSKAIDDQLLALNAEDPDRVMALFHPRAPGLKQTRKSLVGMFRALELRYTLVSKHYVGVDEPYAYMRVIQETRGGNVKPSRSESLFVFKRKERAWLFWTSVVLDKQPMPDRR